MFLKKNAKIVILLSFLFVSACAFGKTNMVQNYNDKDTKLDIRNYLNGDLEGWGIVKNSKDIVTRKFTVKIQGSWEGNRGIVKRQFSYDDGTKDSITWLITVDNKYNYTAIGHDIKGEAKGRQYGSVTQTLYNVVMPIDGEKQKITVEDVTYAINDSSLISIVSLKKFGLINKGEIIMGLRKLDKN